jgi:dynein heavy chain
MSFDDSKSKIEERVKFLQIKFTSLLFENVCRSLFEKDKLLISFLMTVKIMTGQERVDPLELRFLMTGGVKTESERENPTTAEGSWLTDKQWVNLCELDDLKCFKGFSVEFEKSLAGWKAIWDSEDPQGQEWPDGWKDKTNELQ